MLIFSRARIRLKTFNGQKQIKVEGEWELYRARINEFFSTLPVDACEVKHLFGRIRVKGLLQENWQQRVRNFMVNECRLKT